MNKNLNNGNEILGAMIAKGGIGIVTKLAKDNGVTKRCISSTVHGTRKNPEKIQIIANYLGQTVYGIEPKGA